MIPLVSPLFRGSVLAEATDLEPGRAVLGRPMWGELELLRNLELRLGLPAEEEGEAVRVQRWSQRLHALSRSGRRFYTASYGVDPVGTAKLLLEQRDELVLAGFRGDRVPGGGERLEVFAALSVPGHDEELASGLPDRLLRVIDELEAGAVRLYERLELAEREEVWPVLWRRVFRLLEVAGTQVLLAEPAFVAGSDTTDLGRVQALLRGETAGALELAGDGSLCLFTGETSWELGRAVAALLGALEDEARVVLRGGDVAALEAGLAAEGLASQGLRSASAWRPVSQVLPLALELAFEPRDPARVLELLTLHEGPFRGVVGRELALALCDMPGIGGRPWKAARDRLGAMSGVGVRESLERVGSWLEAPGHPVSLGAPREELLAVVARVSGWLRDRLAAVHAALGAGEGDAERRGQATALAAASHEARVYAQALAHDPRPSLTLVEARQLLEEVEMDRQLLALRSEASGRFDHVSAPACLRAGRDTVVWWHCVAGTEWRPLASRWHRSESAALAAAGVLLVPATERLEAEARSFRRVVLAARKRLVLATPRAALGEVLAPHPIWDEIVARTGASAASLARVTLDAGEWLANPAVASRIAPHATKRVAELSISPLPEPRGHWALPAELVRLRDRRHAASTLEALVSCPLKWVLRNEAALYPSSGAGLPAGATLMGKLAHRLVEELHQAGELFQGEHLQCALERQIQQLFATEAAALLQTGQASERTQLARQLARAVEFLCQLVVEAELEVAGVEVESEMPFSLGTLFGRIDLLLRDRGGQEVIVDLKWGASRYRDLLSSGTALQLASYAALRRAESGSSAWPSAGYLSISNAQVHATRDAQPLSRRGTPLSGPPLSETWTRLERHAEHVTEEISRGRVAVTGLTCSAPVSERAGADRARELLELEPGSACQYCNYAALCGRSWEGFR